MTLALVVGIFVLFYWMYDSAKRKTKSNNWYNSEKGSRQVEKEEWEKWIWQLCNEYCELANITVDFGQHGFNPFKVEIDYDTLYHYRQIKHSCDIGKVFGDDYRRFTEYQRLPKFTDKTILEKLRIEHSLPSDTELKGTPYSNASGDKSNYEGLDDIMRACVRRAVHQRGFKYGGTDFEAANQKYLKMKSTQAKHSYLNNNPSDKK